MIRFGLIVALLASGAAFAVDEIEAHAQKARELAEAARKNEQFGLLRRAGAEYFFAGKIDASVDAFDEFAKRFPEHAPELWERGISLYYAGRFADARKQFELHRTVNPNDVENAAWHFICAAKETSVAEARKHVIDIDTDRDTRIPMKEIYALFKGDGKPEDVLAAARAGNPPADDLKNNLCYAHLYLGLYCEALGDGKLAREHMEKAALEYAQPHYMGLVAQVHFRRMKTETPK
jgi:lipoprotein NlpI